MFSTRGTRTILGHWWLAIHHHLMLASEVGTSGMSVVGKAHSLSMEMLFIKLYLQ